MAKTKQDPPPLEQPFVQHLIELRDRLMRVVLVVIVVFLSLFAFANDIYGYLAAPLMRHLPEGASMIATEVASPFLTPFKLTLVLSVFIAIPVILYHLWGFIAPGLYKNERRLVFPLMFSSTLLFFLGMAFAYYVVFPLVFGFLVGIAPQGVAVMTDITKYLDFVLKMFFAFGIAFEVPIATILVVWSGMTTAEELAKKRPYIIVGAFVFGMLLTPPDVISQTLLALPMWVLFELGLIFSRWYTKPQEDEEGETGGGDDGGDDGGGSGGASPSPRPGPAGVTETVVVNGNTVTTTPDGKTTFSFGDAAGAARSAQESVHEKDAPTEAELDAELDRIEEEEAQQEFEEIQNTIQPPETVTDSGQGDATAEELEISSYDSPELAEELRDDGIDNEAHSKATADAMAAAREAAGDVGDYRERISQPEDDGPVALSEEDHESAAQDAMAFARAAREAAQPAPKPDQEGQDTAHEDTATADSDVDVMAADGSGDEDSSSTDGKPGAGK